MTTRFLSYRILALVVVALCFSGRANADFVINDDLIVDGSACVGFDCVNGEVFGFDTIKLKENNLRIKFDDTSTTASFPQRDWQILVNDSANGGLERFSIEDVTAGRIPFTVEGNAPNNALYVDNGGRLGLGTSNPVLELHVVDGDTPTLRLEQDGSSGFTPQTWDVAGNETNFFVRDATNGSRLPFRIRPSAPSNSIFVDTDGDVGLGTSSPASKVDIKSPGTTQDVLRVTRSGASELLFRVREDGGENGVFSLFAPGTTERVAFNANPAGTSFTLSKFAVGRNTIDTGNGEQFQVSDGTGPDAYCDGEMWVDVSSRDAKENIDALDTKEAVEAFRKLAPVSFNYKGNPEEVSLGFIAEDVPELVAFKDRRHLKAMDIVAVLTKVVQEQQRSAEEQQEVIAELKTRLLELEQKVDE